MTSSQTAITYEQTRLKGPIDYAKTRHLIGREDYEGTRTAPQKPSEGREGPTCTRNRLLAR